eukprot:gene12690-15001_t
MRSQDPLFEFGGYLFENDVHLSHGATTDAKVTVDDNVVAGDFDAVGNVGLFGMSTRENGHLPRAKIEEEFPIGHKGRPRSYNRQLFTRLDGSRDPDTFCTRRRDNFDNVTVFEVPPHPQDAKVDVGDCDVLDRKVKLILDARLLNLRIVRRFRGVCFAAARMLSTYRGMVNKNRRKRVRDDDAVSRTCNPREW